MNKELFLKTIRDRLSDLPQEDIEERLMFYEEMIDDLITRFDRVFAKCGRLEG